MNVSPISFSLDIPQAELNDLADRLRRTRFPDEVPGGGWAYGSDLSYVRRLTDYWSNGFDWRRE
ncbi:epoxide hydrolase N-terminal domain-containing protein, partial [Streptomyces galilaeus]|uniref:epoxide hydrolase N-terminal domain-containing protein n=1 Tax=Streptomyces galilaeus TaxID=33899 RepID=UPI0038F78FAD